MYLELFKSDPTRKSKPKSKVNRPENIFCFQVYRTDNIRNDVVPEPVDNRKWETWTRTVTEFCNRHITVNRDYPNLKMNDPSHTDPNHARNRTQSG